MSHREPRRYALAAGDRRIAAATCLFGIAGALVLLAGDFMFYGVWGEGGGFDPLATMAGRAPLLLIGGALMGPVGGLLYAAGAGYFLTTTRAATAIGRSAATAAMALLGITIGFYHLAFAFLGVAARLSLASERASQLTLVRSLLADLNVAMYVCGGIGTALIIILRATGRSRMPIWLLPLLPTLTPLAATLAPSVLHGLPAPWGALVRGGWDNGCFLLFFTAALAHTLAHGTTATVPGRA